MLIMVWMILGEILVRGVHWAGSWILSSCDEPAETEFFDDFDALLADDDFDVNYEDAMQYRVTYYLEEKRCSFWEVISLPFVKYLDYRDFAPNER